MSAPRSSRVSRPYLIGRTIPLFLSASTSWWLRDVLAGTNRYIIDVAIMALQHFRHYGAHYEFDRSLSVSHLPRRIELRLSEPAIQQINDTAWELEITTRLFLHGVVTSFSTLTDPARVRQCLYRGHDIIYAIQEEPDGEDHTVDPSLHRAARTV